MFGQKVTKTSKKFKGLGCLNCPNNRFKTDSIREDALMLLSDSRDIDLLFCITEDNDKVFDLIEKYFSKFKIGILYLTKCQIDDMKASASEIDCCKKQITELISSKIDSIKVLVGFSGHFLKWIYGYSYDAWLWRQRLCPVDFNGQDTYQYVCLDYTQFDRLKPYEQKEHLFQLEVDFKNLKEVLKNYHPPKVYKKDFEDGIKCISGMEPDDYDKLKKELERMKKYSHVAIDIENTPLKPWQKNKDYPDKCNLVCVAIGTFNDVISFPIEHPKAWKGKHDITDKIHDLFEDFLLNSGTKICHNLKHELHWFYSYYGKEVLYKTKWADTMSLNYILNHITEKKEGMHSLGKITLIRYGFNIKKLKEVDFKELLEAPILDTLTYCGRDAKWTHKLFDDLYQELPKSQYNIFDFHNEDCITWAVAETEGYQCDTKLLDKLEEEYTKKVNTVKDRILSLKELKGIKFDLSSSPQLAKVLKDAYDIVLPETNKGEPKADKEELQKLSDKGNTLAKEMLIFRGLDKNLSTYITGMKKWVHPDSYFHSNFNSNVTKTGRKTSNEPNGQNFPKRKSSNMRNIVIPEKDCLIVAVDYGQLEARGYCMAANARGYIDKIKRGEDVHMQWAKRILELYPDAFVVENDKDLKAYRGIVKNSHVFPSFYGAGVYSRARNLGLPVELMQQIDEEFWADFPEIKLWQDETNEFYRKHGYVETLTGRRLRKGKPERMILSRNDICNFPIQGTCSDIVCDAANRLSRMSFEYGEPGLHPILNIHDDLTFMRVPKKRVVEFCEIIMKEMCRKTFDFILDVPLQVELAIGETWGSMKDTFVKDTRDFVY